MKDRLLSVKLDGDELVIRIGISALAFAAIHAPQLEHFDDEANEFRLPKITDERKFAEEVAIVLGQEEEDGTTLVHRMLDGAFLEAVEQGREGILIYSDPEYPAPPPGTGRDTVTPRDTGGGDG